MTNNDTTLKIKDIIKNQDREEAYYQLVSLYFKGPEQIREQIRKNWDYGVEWIFPNQRRLACTKDEKHSSHERILASLAYDAIEDFQKEDVHEKLVALSVVYHSCIEAGLNANDEFESIAAISSERVATFFRDFIQRNHEDKSKEAFMLTTKINSDDETEIFPSWME